MLAMEVNIQTLFNSHTGGMAVARQFGFIIDFLRNPFPESAA